MPAMLRPSKKATRIAFNILGVPANLLSPKVSKKQKEFNERTRSIATRFVRGA